MAKRGKPVAERGVERFAEELGRLLGVAQAKADDWLGQRKAIAKTLEGIRDTADRLLQQLGHADRSVQRRGRAAGPGGLSSPLDISAASEGSESSRTRRVMSAEARDRIRQAQHKRWAKHRAAAKKK